MHTFSSKPCVTRIAIPIAIPSDRVVEPTEERNNFRNSSQRATDKPRGERVARPIGPDASDELGDENPLIREWLKIGGLIRQERRGV